MIETFGITDVGCVRANNEDCFLLAPEIGLCVLADGMGGANAGERASQIATRAVVEAMRESPERTPEALQVALDRANSEVLSVAKSDRSLEGMGTTLVAALDCGDEIYIASVGDSRAYLLDQESLQPVTQDQSWANEIGRAMGLDDAALKMHPLRHVLTMAIGAGQKLTSNVYRVPWEVGSLLLLSSDGLHGVVSSNAIETVLRRDESLEDRCRRLIQAAREAGGPDNITAVLLHRAA